MSAEELRVSDRNEGARFEVFAKPKASRSKIVGVREGALAVALAAPPVDGAANRELIKVLARALGVKRKDVTISRGESGRRKLVDVVGLDAQQVVEKLRALVA